MTYQIDLGKALSARVLLSNIPLFVKNYLIE